MKKVEKKVWPEYFQLILDEKKKYEFRLNDFEINEGDILVLREWDPNKKDYTGRVLEKKVGYVGKLKDFNFWTEEEISKYGFQIISLE